MQNVQYRQLKMAETSTLPCDDTATVTIALFTGVENVTEIREELRKGKVDACLLTPRLVVDKLQALTAANKAYYTSNHGKQITKNIYSEVIYTISPSKNRNLSKTEVFLVPWRQFHNKITVKNGNLFIIENISNLNGFHHTQISESFKNFGVREDDLALLAVLFNDTDGQKLRALEELIKGHIIPLDTLPSLYDRDSVMKMYKVTDGELRVGNLTEAVVQRIALKDIV